MNKAIFLDRDGVIVKNVGGEAPLRVSDLELIPETILVILELKKRGYKIIIVSNQPNYAQGMISEGTKTRLVKKFEKLLKENSLDVDAIYYCFHHPQGVVKKYSKYCDCKKPKPGMILKAIKKYKIDPTKSYIAGDRATDIKAGNSAGVKTILLDPENAEVNYLLEYQVNPDFVVKKITDILNII